MDHIGLDGKGVEPHSRQKHHERLFHFEGIGVEQAVFKRIALDAEMGLSNLLVSNTLHLDLGQASHVARQMFDVNPGPAVDMRGYSRVM